MSNAQPVIACKQLSKTYRDGELCVDVFQNINLTIHPGEMTAIIGPSGAGKSTLLQLMGGLDQPTAGEVAILGKSLSTLSELEKCVLRNQHLGFIYQFHHLLPEFTALENVCMPLRIANNFENEKAIKMLADVGLSHRVHHRIQELSGGERQRVAIARALVHQPACVLADEPTGNLDHATSDIIFELLLKLSRQHQSSIVMVTHNESLARRCDNILTLEKGGLNA